MRNEAAALRVVQAAQAAVEDGGTLLRAFNRDAARAHPELPTAADPGNNRAQNQTRPRAGPFVAEGE